MQDFQGDGSVTLDTFSDQVKTLPRFYRWEEQESCPQACVHHRGTLSIVHVRRAEDSTQARDMRAMYKVQFRSHHRRQMEDIYTYIETLQCLIDLAWPFMDYHAKQETVTNQFLLRMGNHELSVQVAAHGHRGVEDI